MELVTADLAEAFEVRPVTVNSWVHAKRLRGYLPRGARRLGMRFTLGQVREFARAANDEGYTERQLERWLSRRSDVQSRNGSGDASTFVLESEQSEGPADLEHPQGRA